MPTAYTEKLYNGTEDIEAKEFIMKCARAFQAFISMRDLPLDAPIPERLEPNTYHLEMKNDAIEYLERVKRMSDEEIEQMIAQGYQKNIVTSEAERKEKNELRLRYENMINKVEQWQPPSKEHVELKNFCIDQLEESIKYDCSIFTTSPEKQEKLSIEEWRAKRIHIAERDIEYHQKSYAEEVKRTEQRNKWIQELVESFQED